MEIRDNLGRFTEGYDMPLEWKRKIAQKMYRKYLGRKLPEETKKKIGISNKGKKKPLFTKEHRKKISLAMKGQHRSPSTEFKVGQLKGDKNPHWKGGITPFSLYHNLKYKEWRKKIFKRDKFTCQNLNCSYCHNNQGAKLHAHHIKTVAMFPELAFDNNNGITYCVEFHVKLKHGRKIEKEVE